MDIESVEVDADVYSSARGEPVVSDGRPSQQDVILVRPRSREATRIAALLGLAGFRLNVAWPQPEPMQVFENGARGSVVLVDCCGDPQVGLRLLWEFRRRGIRLPIVCIVTRRIAWLEESALELGAADVIDCMVRPSILGRRINRAALMNGVADDRSDRAPSLQVGPLQLNVGACRCRWRGRPVDLTVTEFRVLFLLASRADVDVSYREIYDAVRGKGFVAGDGPNGHRTNVRSLIKRMRRKFVAIDPAFDGIQNHAGFGYRWRAPRMDAPAEPRLAVAAPAPALLSHGTIDQGQAMMPR